MLISKKIPTSNKIPTPTSNKKSNKKLKSCLVTKKRFKKNSRSVKKVSFGSCTSYKI